MSTADINVILKEQRNALVFETRLYDAMEYVADVKGILVGQKLDIIDQLRMVKHNAYYGFHIVSGVMNRCNSDSDAYDSKSNDPIKLAQRLIDMAKSERTEAAA
jgi:hypothetical protein